MHIADLMSRVVITCSPEDSIRVAAQRMNDHHCGCLPIMVLDGGRKRLVGIVTDRDIACRAVANGLDPEKTPVGRCMSFPVHTIPADADLLECADHFTAIDVRRLVVVDAQDECLGILSRLDLQRHIVRDAVGDSATSQMARDTPSAIANAANSAVNAGATARTPENPESTL